MGATDILTHCCYEAVPSTGFFPWLCLRVVWFGGRGWGRVPSVHEAVILEALSAEQHLVGVECLGPCEGGYAWTGGEGTQRQFKSST